MSKAVAKIEKVPGTGCAPDQVVYTYGDGSAEVFDIRSDSEKGRYIVENEDMGRAEIRRYLIETEKQFKEIMESAKPAFGFSIVLVTVDLAMNTYQEGKMINFAGVLFAKRVNFYDIAFGDKVYFAGSKFLGWVTFRRVKFFKEADFSNCQFIRRANFMEVKFLKNAKFCGIKCSKKCRFFISDHPDSADIFANERIDFTESQFSDEVDFTNSVFSKGAYFCGVKFFEHPQFKGACFCKQADFRRAEFLGTADFSGVYFLSSANFEECRCSNDITFSGTEFSYDAFFKSANFLGYVDFSFAKFGEYLCLDFATIQELLILNAIMNKDNILNISLVGAVVNNIEYAVTIFEFENRETAMVLKGVAIKQYDRIKALDFHKQEMEIYWAELQGQEGKEVDRLILRVEKWVSDFGTNPWKAFQWFGFWNYVFFITACCLKGSIPESFEVASDTLGWWRGLYYPVNAFLIYEIAKSLRKFSRRL